MAVKKTKSEEFLDYIEKVEDEPKSELPSVEADFVEETGMDYDWYSYTRINLNELDDQDEYEGRPLLLPVEVVQFDEEEDPRYRSRLLLIDDEGEEYLQINLNLKQKGDIQTNVHNASSLYALIGGIQNLSNPQWTTMFNRIKKVDLSEWETYINSKESMTVEIKEKSGSNFTYKLPCRSNSSSKKPMHIHILPKQDRNQKNNQQTTHRTNINHQCLEADKGTGRSKLFFITRRFKEYY